MKMIWKKIKSAVKPERIDFPDDPFELLIGTIISQHTRSSVVKKTMENLKSRVKITPQSLANTNLEEIEVALKPAGLYKTKSRKIKEISQLIVEKYNGDIHKILNQPLEVARKSLLELPGVGEKTADVVLSAFRKGRTIPIDTNITRVAKRLGMVSNKANYSEIQKEIQKLVGKDDPFTSHLILIRFAWQYCKPIAPLCHKCPISKNCKFYIH